MPREGRLLTIHCAGPDPIAVATSDANAPGHEGIALYVARLAPHREGLSRYHALLDPAERERAARFRFQVDRERFVIAHGLLRTLLGERLGDPPGTIRFGRGPFGKPFVEGGDLHFNLSDTKDALVIAISGAGEIGVDLETMARSVDHLAVSEHYFTPEEIVSIREAGSGTATVDPPPPIHDAAGRGASKRRFLEFWTRKEAVLKASGVGIMEDLRILRVDAPLNTMTISHQAFLEHAAARYHLHTWHLGPEHILSVAQEAPVQGVRLFQV